MRLGRLKRERHLIRTRVGPASIEAVRRKASYTSRDAIEARLVVERPLTEAEQGALRARIHTTLPYPFRIDFDFVAEIPRSPGGKYEDFVSQIGD